MTWVYWQTTFLPSKLFVRVSSRLLKPQDRKSGLVSNTNIYIHVCANRVISAIVSGGFATVHPNNRLTINAVEAAPLEDFSLEVSMAASLVKMLLY